MGDRRTKRRGDEPWRGEIFQINPSGPPGSFRSTTSTPPSAESARKPRKVRPEPGDDPIRRRRTVDTATGASLLLSAPWLAYSLFVMSLAGAVLGDILGPSGAITLAVVIGWLLTGGLIFYRPAEVILARVLLRARRPTPSEMQRLNPAWREATAAAGIDADDYRLWVEDTDALNAYAAGGHVVTITRQSMESMPPHHLTAVLAHELGHHVGGHAWARLLMYWYSVPARYFTRGMRMIGRAVVATLSFGVAMAGRAPFLVLLIARIVTWGFLLSALFLLGSWVILAAQEGTYWPTVVMTIVVLAPVLLPYLARQSEYRADRFAAQLGYGEPLIEVFENWLRQGMDDGRSNAAFRAQLFHTHPSLSARIHKLTAYLNRIA